MQQGVNTMILKEALQIQRRNEQSTSDQTNKCKQTRKVLQHDIIKIIQKRS